MRCRITAVAALLAGAIGVPREVECTGTWSSELKRGTQINSATIIDARAVTCLIEHGRCRPTVSPVHLQVLIVRNQLPNKVSSPVACPLKRGALDVVCLLYSSRLSFSGAPGDEL